ncbi:ATP-grasp domain-containing protein [Kitasatospora sp. NPDC058965]|uniref:ATP-binding protein n=1 Tax=Kitasatospora sp. NPDC058965 TaxID=3346682 RepID=UPI0036C6AEC8
MLNVLILNRSRLTKYPFRQWLGPQARLTVLTHARGLAEHGAASAAEAADYDAIHLVDGYDHAPQVEQLAHRLHAERPFDALLALSEFDVLRAARLREVLGIPGQRYDSALAYRDKAVMKDHWRAAGVPAAAHTAVEQVSDLLAAADDWGYPLVVKPRLGSGSTGVAVLRDRAELDDWLDRHWRPGSRDRSPWLAEAFVDGEMYHLDGVFDGERAEFNWPSATTPLLAHHRAGALVDVLVDPADPLVPGLRELTVRALRALPGPRWTVFHAEVWRTADGRLLLNEIASRPGGGLIPQTVRAAFGQCLVERFVRLSVGRDAGPAPLDRPRRAAGFTLLPPRPGEVLDVPPLPARFTADPYEEAELTVTPGQWLRPAGTSVDRIASCLAVGRDGAEVAELLGEFGSWVATRVRIGGPA